MTKKRESYEFASVPKTVAAPGPLSSEVDITYLSYEAAATIWSNATAGEIEVQVSATPSGDDNWDVLGTWVAGVTPVAYIIPNFIRRVRLNCTVDLVDAAVSPVTGAVVSGIFDKDA